VTIDFAGDDDAAFGVALQSDGKIVAAGVTRTGESVVAVERPGCGYLSWPRISPPGNAAV